MEYQVLGPMRATYRETPVVIGSARQQRLVLAALLSRAGRPASADWLITALWPDRPPPTARRNIQVLVYQLRRALGGDQILGRSEGYVIPASASLDSRRFRELTAQGSAALEHGQTTEGGRLLRSALDLWRGPAFTEFVDWEPVAAEAASLEELRVTAYERWAQAELAVGHHGAVLDELGDLVRADPYREALAAQLMRGLSLSGSKGKALEVFESTRQALREHLGVDPGPVLRRLHEQILRDEVTDSSRRTFAPPDLPDITGRAADMDLRRSPAYEGRRDPTPAGAEAGVPGRLRLSAFEEWVDLELDAGNHEGVLGQLESMIAENPYRERLRAQQMLALYRSGRQADALEVYQQTCRLLVSDLGVHPTATLTELHQRILAGNPVSTTVKPAQLPLAVRGFSGRSQELGRLDAILAGSGDSSSAVTVIVISGMGGVGKTALALHWARRIIGGYPDGQLYLDLRGQSEHDQLTAIAALARLLQAFGLKPEQIPADPVAAAGLFRSSVAGRRLLIVLDNARSSDQVRPLLPGGGGCAVVVTSRHRLGDLRVHDGALGMDLDALRPAEAEGLLAGLLGDAHRSESSAVAEIARLCGYLPLAVRIAAARLAEQPERGSGWLRDELAGDDRLGALQMDGEEGVAVRAAFELSYRSVPPGIQRLFTLLGLFPGTDFGVDAVAALAGLPRSVARRALGHLATVHMIRARPDGRYDFHDLIREYAQNLAANCQERQVARGRLYAWYAGGAEKAARILHPQFLMLSPGHPPEAADSDLPDLPDLPDSAAATTWLDSEFVALSAAIRHGVRDGQAGGTVRLADALRGYLVHRATLSDWLVITDAAMAAADTVGDPRAEVAAHMHAATAYGLRDDYQRSIQHLLLAFDLAQRIGWTISATMAQANLAGMYLRIGEIALAHRAVLHARDTFLQLGNDDQVTNSMLNLGAILVEMGRPAEAVETIAEVFAKAGKLVMPSKWVSALETYGLALHRSGQHQLAREHLSQALEQSRQLGNHALETLTLTHLAAVASEQGDHEQAWDLANQARMSAQVCGQPRIEAEALNLIAFLHIREGNGVSATAAATRAHGLASGVGARRTEIEALITLALSRHLIGEDRAATESARHANEMAAKCGYDGLARQAAEILTQPQTALNRRRIS